MIYVRVLWIGASHQGSHPDALVEFARDVPEVSCGNFEPLALAYTVTKFVSSLQILVAQREVAKITVRRSQLEMGQRKLPVQFDGAFEGWHRFRIFALASQFNSERKILESRERRSSRL